jgi:AcrR family transcriptional regulator
MGRKLAVRPRKQASQERSRATIDAILAATARVLVKHGYDQASTNRVAEAAGVSIGSLYQYFPSKEALVAAVIERHMSDMAALAEASFVRLAALPMRQAVRELVTLMIEVHRLEPKLHRVLFEQIPRVGGLERLESLDERSTPLVKMYLEAHRDEIDVPDIDLAAFMTVSCVESMTHLAVLRRPELLADPRFVDEVAGMVVRYLEGEGSKRRRTDVKSRGERTSHRRREPAVGAFTRT